MIIQGKKYKALPNGCLIPESMVRERVQVLQSSDLMNLLLEFAGAKQEMVIVFTLDGANKVIKRRVVTIGLANQSHAHPREVFRPAILDAAVSILVAHNHPSGKLEPSTADLVATRKLAEAGRILGIPLLDHLIFSPESIYSIRQEHPKAFKS